MSIRRAAKKAVRAIGQSTGAGAIARAVVDAHDAGLKKAVSAARTIGISEKTIERALRAYQKTQKLQDAIAIMFPGMPSQLMLRTLSGSKSLRDVKESISPKGRSKR